MDKSGVGGCTHTAVLTLKIQEERKTIATILALPSSFSWEIIGGCGGGDNGIDGAMAGNDKK